MFAPKRVMSNLAAMKTWSVAIEIRIINLAGYQIYFRTKAVVYTPPERSAPHAVKALLFWADWSTQKFSSAGRDVL